VYVATSGNKIYSVNPSTCAATRVATVNAPNGTFNGITFTGSDTLLGADTAGAVTQIDLATGASTHVGDYGGTLVSSGDLVVLSTGVIYATARDALATGSDLLVTLDPGNRYAATVVGPLTGFTQIYGLGFWGGVLYGFDGAGDVLSIDPATAAVTVIASTSQSWYGAGTTPLAPSTEPTH
jgi:hypothetical protein